MQNRKLFIGIQLILLLGLLSSLNGFADSRSDSLLTSISSTDDKSAKLLLYAQLIRPKAARISPGGKLLVEKALQIAHDLDSNYHKALFHIYIGEYYIHQGSYSESFEEMQIAIGIAERIKSFNLLTHANIDIAIIYFYWTNYEKAEEYIIRALNYADKDKNSKYYGSIYSLLGSIYGEKKDPEKAKHYMLKYLYQGIKSNNSSDIISAYNNLALVSNEMNQVDSSLFYSRLALNIAEQSNDFNGQHTLCNSLARIYISINQLDSAHLYLNKALKLKDIATSPRKILFTYKYAYNYFKKTQFIDSALYYHEIYVNYNDSLFGLDQFNKISELETKLETEKHQIIIKNLEIKNKINTLLMYGISLVLILILVISILVYRSVRLKNNLMRQNQELLEEKSAALKTKVDFQQREMFNNALYIINQNKMYDNIIKDFKEFNKLSKEDQSTSFNALIHKIQKNKQGSEQKDFEVKFKNSHQNFYKKLKEKYPELTKKDLDLCAFLNLNMSTKEIAALTNQSTRAIEVSRSRLRKKLNIDLGTNLSEFIRNI